MKQHMKQMEKEKVEQKKIDLIDGTLFNSFKSSIRNNTNNYQTITINKNIVNNCYNYGKGININN